MDPLIAAASSDITRISTKVYVGNLAEHTNEDNVKKYFQKFGKIIYVDIVKATHPPHSCYIKFENYNDAKAAVKEANNHQFRDERHCFHSHVYKHPNHIETRLKVQIAYDEESSLPHPEYRVVVRNLPMDATGQQLMDHMEEAGAVAFAEVYKGDRYPFGLVEYKDHKSMKFAIDNFNGREFHFGHPDRLTKIEVLKFELSCERDSDAVADASEGPAEKGAKIV